MFKNVKKEIITVPAQMSYLSQIRDFVEQVGRKYRYSDKLTNSFKLVIDEACTNIIRHGYRDIKGGEITLTAIIRRMSLTIVVIDQGKSYDPRQANTPDLEKYINIGKKGGLGILMMRKLMDDVQYNVTSRGNELRLTKQREEVISSKPQAMWENLSMRTRYTIIASSVVSILLAALFFVLYFQVDNDTLEEIVEVSSAHVLSLADNSMNDLLLENDIPLFELINNIKINNPNLIYECFIVDTAQYVWALTLRDYDFSKYEIPSDHEVISDSSAAYELYKYSFNDEIVYDFSAPIHANVDEDSPVIGFAHIWVKSSYIVEKAKNTKMRIILGTIVLLIFSYLLIYFLVAKIVQPFHSLADWVRQVGQGKVEEDEIDIDASDELGEVAQAFTQMTGKFREAQENLMEQQRLQKELQVAQEIQHMLLPSDFPKVEGYDIGSFYEAAKEVGGDLFDFVEVDKDTIGICVADVSGKGVPGSLIMTMIRTALRLEARGNKNPADVLSRVNKFVTEDMKRGMFVTMFYLVLDSRKRIIHYASAGHNPMILYRRSKKQSYYLNPSGFPVGIQLPDITLFDKKIQQDSIRLREDDLLVLYTDGITEAMNPERELYREERFLEAIRDNSHYDVGEFIKQLRDNINSHTQGYPQNDDITYVAIKEKMMAGEVIYNIHKELFRLIEEEGISVKDACESMKVSQYMYRKYKKIKEQRGVEGLKELLNETDYIEKKHLSIEVKTKLYDVIRQHPKYGPKKLAETLNTEEYNYTELEEHRIYQELIKAKLNTREKREAFVAKGGKKRIKLPGTPLLTMDGDVILNYESAEKAIAEKKGISTENYPKPHADRYRDEKSETTTKKIVSIDNKEKKVELSKEESDSEKNAIVSDTEKIIQKDESVEKTPVEETPSSSDENLDIDEKSPAEEESEENIIDDKKDQQETSDLNVEELEETEPKQAESLDKQEEITLEIEDIKGDSKDEQAISEEIELEVPKEFDTPEIPDDKSQKDSQPVDEDRKQTYEWAPPSLEIDKDQVETFYKTVKDDFDIIENVLNSITDDNLDDAQINKILITLKIIDKNPFLKKLDYIKKQLNQVIDGIDIMYQNQENFDETFNVTENIKEMLNYIKKENILLDSNQVIEKVNELGIHLFKLKSEINQTESKFNSDLALIRKKIADKRILNSDNLRD